MPISKANVAEMQINFFIGDLITCKSWKGLDIDVVLSFNGNNILSLGKCHSLNYTKLGILLDSEFENYKYKKYE